MKTHYTFIALVSLLMIVGTACQKDIEPVSPPEVEPEEQKEESYGLPVVEIFTEALQPVTSKETYVTGTITVKDNDKKYTDGKEFKSGMKIKGRGNTTWQDPKKPYRIKLDEKASVLGLNKSKNWCLLAEYEDKSLLRNQTAMEISRICGMTWTPAMISVEVYLNNEYLGIYTFCENKEVAKNRVDIDLDKGDVYLELEQFMDNPVCFWTTHRLPVMFSDPEEPSNELKETIIQRFRDFENVLYSENFTDPESGYAPMIDVESVINYYIIQELTKNIDGNLRKSTFITLGPDSPLKFYHVWDFDRALGNCYYFPSEYPGTTNDYTGWFIKDQTLEHNEGWFARFFKDPAFVSGLQQKWAEVYPLLRNVPSDFIDVKARELDKAQQRNFQKWQILGTETYRDKVQKMRDFYMKRLEWLNSEIPKLD